MSGVSADHCLCRPQESVVYCRDARSVERTGCGCYPVEYRKNFPRSQENLSKGTRIPFKDWK